ncbi:MAG: Dipeptidase [Bacteroidota bacterium]|jgi:dipeptidase E
MKLLIVSTSTVYGKPYLSYLEEECKNFFEGKNILFVPFARPGGLSHDAYTAKAKEVFEGWGFTMRGAHEFENAADGCHWADGFFTGGGNTFELARTIRTSGYFDAIDAAVRAGKPYMGTSAGCNLAGLTIGTTNDMPIVYPPSFEAFGWVPFNINPHYLDPIEGSTHMGETRETRIAEFHHYNDQPVVGLREGSWIRVENNSFQLKGEHTARLFEKGKKPVEIDNISFL